MERDNSLFSDSEVTHTNTDMANSVTYANMSRPNDEILYDVPVARPTQMSDNPQTKLEGEIFYSVVPIPSNRPVYSNLNARFNNFKNKIVTRNASFRKFFTKEISTQTEEKNDKKVTFENDVKKHSVESIILYVHDKDFEEEQDTTRRSFYTKTCCYIMLYVLILFIPVICITTFTPIIILNEERYQNNVNELNYKNFSSNDESTVNNADNRIENVYIIDLRTTDNIINANNIKIYYYDSLSKELSFIPYNNILTNLYDIDSKGTVSVVHCELYLNILKTNGVIITESVYCYSIMNKIEIVSNGSHFTVIVDFLEMETGSILEERARDQCMKHLKILTSEILKYKNYDKYNVYIKVKRVKEKYALSQYCDNTLWLNNTEEYNRIGHSRFGFIHLSDINIAEITPDVHGKIKPPLISCLHQLTHILGFNTNLTSYNRYLKDKYFTGIWTKMIYGKPLPMSDDYLHIARYEVLNYLKNQSIKIIGDPNSNPLSTVNYLTNIFQAVMKDLGFSFYKDSLYRYANY